MRVITPVDCLLFCPECGTQHIDAPDPNPSKNWSNPPHKSHLCGYCGTIWRPADVPTNGVAVLQTRGARDTWGPEPVCRPALEEGHG